jgi:hypothetical protein
MAFFTFRMNWLRPSRKIEEPDSAIAFVCLPDSCYEKGELDGNLLKIIILLARYQNED